jgi:hypothetical protein
MCAGPGQGAFNGTTNRAVHVDEDIQGYIENANFVADATAAPIGGGPIPGSAVTLPPLIGAAPAGQTSAGSGLGFTSTVRRVSFHSHEVSDSSSVTSANGHRTDGNSSDLTLTGDLLSPDSVGGVPVGDQPPDAGGNPPAPGTGSTPPAGSTNSNTTVTGQASITSNISAHTTLVNEDSSTTTLTETGTITAGEWRQVPGSPLTASGSGSAYVAKYRLAADGNESSTYTEVGNGTSSAAVTANTNGDKSVRSNSRWAGNYGLHDNLVANSTSEERGYALDISGFVQSAGPFTPGVSGSGSVTFRTRTAKENENDNKSYVEGGRLERDSTLKGTSILIGKSNTSTQGTYSAVDNDHLVSDLTVDAETWGASGSLSFNTTNDLRSSSGSVGVSGGGSVRSVILKRISTRSRMARISTRRRVAAQRPKTRTRSFPSPKRTNRQAERDPIRRPMPSLRTAKSSTPTSRAIRLAEPFRSTDRAVPAHPATSRLDWTESAWAAVWGRAPIMEWTERPIWEAWSLPSAQMMLNLAW